MKIKTWIKYEESYLPPRCRKLRYRECEDFVDVNLREVDGSELKLAFEDNSFEGKGKIYLYKGKLWCKTKINPNTLKSVQEKDGNVQSALDYLIYCHEHCSTYFRHSFDRERGEDTSRETVLKIARDSMKGYILVDGELYGQTSEPRYEINTFGLGHNHGGTGLFCVYGYNPNICKDRYFSALEGEQAVAYANKVAEGRGDTKDVGRFEPFIVCHMPELVKVKPNKQHGKGNELFGALETIVTRSKSATEAGLLTMAFTACLGLTKINNIEDFEAKLGKINDNGISD